jgi:hypothetical protein
VAEYSSVLARDFYAGLLKEGCRVFGTRRRSAGGCDGESINAFAESVGTLHQTKAS